jgi:hypothetical protein
LLALLGAHHIFHVIRIRVNSTYNFSGMDMSKEWKRGDCQKKLGNGVHQEEKNEVDLNLPGRKGLED